MALYLCVDGGGTKTTAVVTLVCTGEAGTSPVTSTGEAGPSNLSYGVESCVSATVQAITRALEPLRSHSPGFLDRFEDKRPVFSRVLAGYAGCARPADFEILRPALEIHFPKTNFELTSDGGLLASPLYASDCDHCVTLICGTGSMGLLWKKENGVIAQIGRSGGWGSVLGDEGSGWSIGREGIKSVLTYHANGIPLQTWHKEILAYFDVNDPDRLLSVATTLTTEYTEADRKKRIAGCARIVCKASEERSDPEAKRIVVMAANQVVELLQPLVGMRGGDVSQTLLIVTGGLGRNAGFWGTVEFGMEKMGMNWYGTEIVTDPAVEGLESIIAREWNA